MSQTHRIKSDRISFKLLIQKTTLKLALYSYYDKNNDFSVFHLNINSLQHHFDELQTLFIKLSH